MDVLPNRLPWFIAGPALGLFVVGLFLVANQPLGATGAYLQTANAVRRKPGAVIWRVWYFAGIFVGGAIAALLGKGIHLRGGYDGLRNVWPLGVTVVVVFAGALVMGYGARMARRCTSGHGICGTAQRSAASWVTTRDVHGHRCRHHVRAASHHRGQAVNRRLNAVGLLFGAGFGFVLGAAKLYEYDTIHRMLRLQEADVFLLMGAAIATSLPLLWLLERRKAGTVLGGRLRLSRTKPQRQHVVGGALFGVGWAVSGTCPAPALVLVASGSTIGIITIAGLFSGLALRDRHAARAPAAVGDGEHRELIPLNA